MTPGARLGVFAAALLVIAPLAWHVARAMPPFGEPASAYGDVVNALVPALRHVTNMISAVNFDIRGMDTVGEEIILLCATTGAVILLRHRPGGGEPQESFTAQGRASLARSEATTLVCRAAVTITLLFAVYVVLHGTVTPGGGFQGGVIAASGLLLIYLGESHRAFRDSLEGPALDILEGAGALGFVLLALLPLLLHKPALSNLLPLGKLRDFLSGGSIFVANLAVGLAVAGSFGRITLELLNQTHLPAGDLPDEEDE